MVIFDIDNTLVDYSKSERESIFQIMMKHNLKIEIYEKLWKEISEKYFTKYLKKEISFEEQGAKRIQVLFGHGDRHLSIEEAKNIFFEYKDELEKKWILFDDVIPCLKRLNAVEKGIASNGQARQQSSKLKRTGIESYFTIQKYASQMNCAKPDVQFFETLKTYCEKGEYIYVGDNLQTDIYPCMKVGIRAIWINRKGEKVPQGVSAIRSLQELYIENYR